MLGVGKPAWKQEVLASKLCMESDADSPDIPDSERGFLTEELPLVPRLVANGCRFHGLSSSVRKYKHDAWGERALSGQRQPFQGVLNQS